MASNLAQVVGTLLDSAIDEDEAVEESVKQALCEIGSARPQAVLSASLKYIEATPNIKTHHRVQILKALYEEEFERAATEDRDRASFNVVPQYNYFRSS